MSPRIAVCIFSAALLTVMVAEPSVAAAGNVDLPRFPSISPDGSEIAFSWRGDLWKVGSGGGHAIRITSHPGDDLRSAWSRDGESIAFDSTRSGDLNVWIMSSDGTNLRQVTVIDRPTMLGAFGVDEGGDEILTFSAALEADVYRSGRPYMVSVNGGELLRLHGAFGTEPVISPDGTRVAFTRGNSSWDRRHYRGPDNRNVWVYDRDRDTFTQLTSWPGNDGASRWGGPRTILFLSDREHDTVNLYRMSADDGDKTAVPLTDFRERDVVDFDVSADGSTAVVMVWDTLYTIDLNNPNAEAQELLITASEDARDNFELKSVNREVSEAALNPDGKVMAVVAYGEIYVRHVDEKSPTQRVTDSHAHEREIAWSPDGLKLYFVSDSDGTDSIYAATVALTRSQIKEEFEKALKPADEPEPPADEVEPDAEESPKEEAENDAKGAKDNEDAADSQDTDEDDGDADGEKEKEDPKPKKPKDPKLDPSRWHDAVQIEITPVVQTTFNDFAPSPSPDGKSLAFRRTRGDLILLDLKTNQERIVHESWDFGTHWQWSADGKWLAYAVNDLDFNSDIWIVPADGSAEAVNVTRHPDNDANPRWSADNRVLSFISERVDEQLDVWMVYLDKSLEVKTPKEIEEYYNDAVAAAKKRKPLPVKDPDAEDDEKKQEDQPKGKDKKDAFKPAETLDLADAYLRLKRVTHLPDNESNNHMTPGGDYYIFSATIAGSTDLYSVKWDGSDRKKIASGGSVQHLNLSGDTVVLVSGSRAATVKPTGGDTKYYDIEDRIRIDLQEQSGQKFLEAARILGALFYHPTMKDLDWAALTEQYHALARQTRTASEFNHVANRLLGELNGSHLGVFARDEPSPNRQSAGRLGIVAHRDANTYVIETVIADSPAAIGPMALKADDRITAVDLEPFSDTDTLDSRLMGKIGEEIIITIERTLDDGAKKELRVLFTPVSYGQEDNLKYKAWQRETAEKVLEWSDGRIGYIHIEGMNQPSLDEFERDLFAAAGDKDGLIIDVRNNGGGWTTDRVLSSIMVQEHAYTIPRGADPNARGHYPQDRLFIQRYTLPINMLCNEKSFSNAEIMSHAFKTLKRGTLVGQETYGGVISTGGTRLIDGTFVRLPFRGWYLPDGTDMENNGAVPDLIVPQTPDAESRDEDEQLKAAVDDLMKRLP